VLKSMEITSKKVLTVRELAHLLKIHPSTIYRLLRHGALPAFKVGSDWRFNIEAIDRWRLRSSTEVPRAKRTPEDKPDPIQARNPDKRSRSHRTWAIEQAQALRDHRAEALDWETLAKEIEALVHGKKPRRRPKGS
jgi:excisionase family DNA binding protein